MKLGNPGWAARLGALTVIGLCTTASLAGCDGESTPGGDEAQAICEEIYEKQRGCNLLSEGERRCGIFNERGYGECVVECLRPASCEEIQSQFCDDADNTYARCLDGCQAIFFFFECGDGTRIDAEDRCNDTPECANGADERDCEPPEPPTFDCGNGELAYADEQCDGLQDCGNGADEAGCPPFAMTICPGGPP